MTKFRTHYDNLKVARNAPQGVIKAAYKALCQVYHPDKYEGGHEQALQIMKLINKAYIVLSDPVKRDRHDKWIVEKERDFASTSSINEIPNKEKSAQKSTTDQLFNNTYSSENSRHNDTGYSYLLQSHRENTPHKNNTWIA